jgi:hypothetical protein
MEAIRCTIKVTDWVWMGWEMKIRLVKSAILVELDPYLSLREGKFKVRMRNQYRRIPEAIWIRIFTRWYPQTSNSPK